MTKAASRGIYKTNQVTRKDNQML